MSNEHITDEREAFIKWLSETYPYVYDKENAALHWRNEHISALAWKARAALRFAAQPVAVPDRVPMTDEQAEKLLYQAFKDYMEYRSNDIQICIIRKVEAHHGITTPKADK